jgi:hypothetical protein
MKNENLWWKHKRDDDVAKFAFSAFEELRAKDGTRRDDMIAWSAIYNDEPYDRIDALGFIRDGKSRMPVLPGMVDSTLSRIARARPLPTVLTVGGDWKAQRKAKLKTTWLQGMFKKLRVHEIMRDVLRDALVMGTGVAKLLFNDESNEIELERVWAGDIYVPELEARHGRVRTYYQVAVVDRGALADQFPKHAKAIEDVGIAAPVEPRNHTDTGVEPGSTDMVEVVEAWRIGTKTSPGMHVICISGKGGSRCLYREEYTKKRPPFVFVRWRIRSRAFWGQGMVESGAGLQSMINMTASTMEECFRLSFPMIGLPEGCNLSPEQMDNSPWVAYRFSGGVPPTFLTPPPFADAYYKYLQMLRQALHETQGVSELAASSQKPAGLNSGKALLVFQDVESERFLIQGRQYEDAHVHLAEMIIEMAEDIYKDKGRAAALEAVGGQKQLEAIEYKKVRFRDQPWEVQVYPVTSLSQSPSGRLTQIQELTQMGVIQDSAVARELLDFPDFERFTSVESGRRRRVEMAINRALDDQEVLPADPYMDLQYAMARGVNELNLAETEGAPDESLDALRDFLGTVDAAIKQKEREAAQIQAEAAAAAGMAAGPAGGMTPSGPQAAPGFEDPGPMGM